MEEGARQLCLPPAAPLRGLLGEIFATRQWRGFCIRGGSHGAPRWPWKRQENPSSCRCWRGDHPSRLLPAWAAISAEPGVTPRLV